MIHIHMTFLLFMLIKVTWYNPNIIIKNIIFQKPFIKPPHDNNIHNIFVIDLLGGLWLEGP